MTPESPHSITAERVILGALMLDPFTVGDIKGLESSDFYRADHGRIYALIVHLAGCGEPHDMMSLVERISEGPRDHNGVERPTHRGKPTDADHWELYGGITYLSCLADDVPSTENLPFYVRQVREYAASRTLIDGSTQISAELTRGYLSADQAKEKMLDLACDGGIGVDSAPIGVAVESVNADIDAELLGERSVFMKT